MILVGRKYNKYYCLTTSQHGLLKFVIIYMKSKIIDNAKCIDLLGVIMLKTQSRNVSKSDRTVITIIK